MRDSVGQSLNMSRWKDNNAGVRELVGYEIAAEKFQ
jgi:hypothetical protein